MEGRITSRQSKTTIWIIQEELLLWACRSSRPTRAPSCWQQTWLRAALVSDLLHPCHALILASQCDSEEPARPCASLPEKPLSCLHPVLGCCECLAGCLTYRRAPGVGCCALHLLFSAVWEGRGIRRGHCASVLHAIAVLASDVYYSRPFPSQKLGLFAAHIYALALLSGLEGPASSYYFTMAGHTAPRCPQKAF